MKFSQILTLAFLLTLSVSFGQGEANNWYFGAGAGVTFNTSPPSALTDGALNTLEGCSSISDPFGNLLFYTDGRTIFNKNHLPMDNANYFGGTGILGDPSSTSSGLIVPHPNDSNLFYVFAVDEPHHNNAFAFPNQGPANPDGTPRSTYSDTGDTIPADDDGFNNGFTYSLVDMRLNNGLGDIVSTEKNIELQTYDPNNLEAIKYKSSEKITAVRGEDCDVFWVITHFVDSFYAFEINANGINTTPVISKIGRTLTTSNYRRAALGYMKASPDASKLALAHHTFQFDQDNDVQTPGLGGVFLYDFDNVTGIVTNETPIIQNVNPYSVEFSPDSSKLYATLNSSSLDSALHQWNLEATPISTSRYGYTAVGRGDTPALQLAPNGKIYLAGFEQTKLRVINEPNNAKASANYSDRIAQGAIPLANGRTARLGLPPFIQSIFSTSIDIINNPDGKSTVLDLCDGDEYTLSFDDPIAGASYQWFENDTLIVGEVTPELDIEQPAISSLPYTTNYKLEVDLNNGECPLVGVAQVTYHEVPVIATQPADNAICDIDNDGVEEYETIQELNAIQGNQDPQQFYTAFYETEEAALRGDGGFTTMLLLMEPVTTLYGRIENIDNPNCFAITSFNLNLLQSPIANTIDSFSVCDTDADGDDTNGEVRYDLSVLDSDIIGNSDVSNFDVDYYESQQDAENATNAVAKTSYTVNGSATLFARVRLASNTSCPNQSPAIVNFTISVNALPTVQPAELVQCQDASFPNGQARFNLTEANETITFNTATTQVRYFEDANLSQPIPSNDYTNTSNNQIVFAEVTNANNCSRIAEVTLRVENRNANNARLVDCGSASGFATFTLSDAEADIKMGLDPSLQVRFYETQEKAFLEEDPLDNLYDNMVAFEQDIYARVEDSNNECFGISIVTLIVNTPPELQEDDEQIYCLENLPQPTMLSSGVMGDVNDFTYTWMPDGQTTETIETSNITTHTVTVTDKATGCSNSRSITITPSNRAEIRTVEITDLSMANTLTVLLTENSIGDYDYALDSQSGPYQDSPVFENVAPGLHTVYVRDKNGCGISIRENIGVLGFMPFFTPNNDGFNDRFRILGITSDREANALVYIYDRYGKLLKTFIAGNGSWDGTFNGKPLPSSDYWYQVILEDGREFKANVTLKR